MNIVEHFIKNGNFTPWVRTVFILLGIGTVYVSLKYFDSLLFMSLGLIFAALGGYSSRANTFGIKPFDNTYKKAKDSYKDDPD
jgi:hypothetical protein